MRIRSTRIWVRGCFLSGVIETDGSVIRRILPFESECDRDLGDRMIVPGFIDIHCHGAYGFDTNYAEPEGLRRWASGITREGVTTFLATTVTDSKETLLKAVRNVRSVCEEGYEGADICGIHLEGPYLDLKYKGAQPPEAIVPPSVEEFREYQEASGNRIRVITLAPEHDKDFELTRYASSHGTVVSMGHSDASFETAVLAAANGASSVTHTFNAMSPFTHRKNGLAGAALRLHDLYSEIICDCNHVTPDGIHIFFRSKDPGRAIMVSDALMCKGFETGTKFDFGGHEIEIYPDGTAHLTEGKALAGSTMRMNEGLKNLVTRAMVPFADALNACTANPASLLKADDHIGRICAGYDADLTVLDDDYNVVSVYCKGIMQF